MLIVGFASEDLFALFRRSGLLKSLHSFVFSAAVGSFLAPPVPPCRSSFRIARADAAAGAATLPCFLLPAARTTGCRFAPAPLAYPRARAQPCAPAAPDMHHELSFLFSTTLHRASVVSVRVLLPRCVHTHTAMFLLFFLSFRCRPAARPAPPHARPDHEGKVAFTSHTGGEHSVCFEAPVRTNTGSPRSAFFLLIYFFTGRRRRGVGRSATGSSRSAFVYKRGVGPVHVAQHRGNINYRPGNVSSGPLSFSFSSSPAVCVLCDPQSLMGKLVQCGRWFLVPSLDLGRGVDIDARLLPV